jgi:hypothetical protein
LIDQARREEVSSKLLMRKSSSRAKEKGRTAKWRPDSTAELTALSRALRCRSVMESAQGSVPAWPGEEREKKKKQDERRLSTSERHRSDGSSVGGLARSEELSIGERLLLGSSSGGVQNSRGSEDEENKVSLSAFSSTKGEGTGQGKRRRTHRRHHS